MSYISFLGNEEIIITDHVIKQFILRMQVRYKKPLTKEDAKRKITQHIRQSRLTSIKGNEEKRNYYGLLYCCKRVKGILNDRIIVKTILLTNLAKKQHHSHNFNLDTVDQTLFRSYA